MYQLIVAFQWVCTPGAHLVQFLKVMLVHAFDMCLNLSAFT